MAKMFLFKFSVLAVCILGVLGMPNQSVNNEKPVNSDHGDSQGNTNTGTHPAGKNECSGNKYEVGTLCREGRGICIYRYDKFGNEGHKDCIGYCGNDLPEGPDNAQIMLPEGYVPDQEDSWTYMTEGSSFEFACATGYGATCSNTEVICLPNGNWSEPAFECKIDCVEPEVTSPKTVVSWSGTLEGDVAVTSCAEGTLAVGGNALTCTYNDVTETGEWVGTGSCVTVCDKDAVPAVDFAMATTDSELYVANGVVSYECGDGYTGCVTATCQANGGWGQPSGSCERVCDKDAVPAVDFAMATTVAEVYVANGVVSYECDDGYTGCVTATCQANGEWGQPSGSCERVCAEANLPAVENAIADDSNAPYVVTEVVLYDCNDGYIGSPNVICGDDGQWGPVSGSCQQSQGQVCSGTDLPTVDNASPNTVGTTYDVNVAVTYTCTDGYTGSPSVNCGADGQWESVSGSCQQSQGQVCSAADLPTVDNASPNTVGTTYDVNVAVTYTCTDGYTGSPSVNCGADGQWESVSGSCQQSAACGDPPVSMDGQDQSGPVEDDGSTKRARFGPCGIGGTTYLTKVCGPNTGYLWVDEGDSVCPDTDGQTCDVSVLTGRANDNNGYLYGGCCYYATQAEKNLEGAPDVSTNAVAYCNVYGNLAGAELAVAQTQAEADFINNILNNQNLADEVWSGLKYVGGQWVDVTTRLPVSIFSSLQIDESEGSIAEGICLGINTSTGAYFTTECSRASHKHKAICQVCPPPSN